MEDNLILESMISLKENNLSLLYESIAVSYWNLLDKRDIAEKIKKVDNKYFELTPINNSSNLTNDEKIKVAKHLRLRKIGGKLISGIIGGTLGYLSSNQLNNKINSNLNKNLDRINRNEKTNLTNRERKAKSYENSKINFDNIESKLPNDSDVRNQREFCLDKNKPSLNDPKDYNKERELLKNKAKKDKLTSAVLSITTGVVIGTTSNQNLNYYESKISNRLVFIGSDKKFVKSIIVLYRNNKNKIEIRSIRI